MKLELLQMGPLSLMGEGQGVRAWEVTHYAGLCLAQQPSPSPLPEGEGISRRGCRRRIALWRMPCRPRRTWRRSRSWERKSDFPADASRPKEEGGSAMELFKVGDYAGALKLWQESSRTMPDLPPAQTIMAQLFLQAEMPKEAQTALDQAIVDAPDDPEAYLLLAAIAVHERDLSKADSLYQKAERLISNSTRAPNGRIRCKLGFPAAWPAWRKPAKTGRGAEGIRGMVEAGAEQGRGKTASRRSLCQEKDVAGCAGKAAGSRQGQPRHVDPRGRSGPILPGDG